MIRSRLKVVDDNFICTQSVVDSINSNGLKLSYIYDNIFDYVSIPVENYKMFFMKDYLNLIKTNNAIKYKYLIDTFLYDTPRTVFGLYETEKEFKISKGHKKIAAYIIDDLKYSHILIVSKRIIGTEITTDKQLFDVLQKLDKNHNDFVIELGSDYSVHIAESSKTMGRWASPSNLLTIPQFPLSVKFSGLAYSTDKRIISDKDYFCHVHSDIAVNITVEYILLCANNTYHNKFTRVGKTKDEKIKIIYMCDYPCGDFYIPNPF